MKFKVKLTHYHTADNELLDDLRRVAKINGSERVAKSDYEEHGNFSTRVFTLRFGSWNMAIYEAGLKPTFHFITNKDLLVNIEEVWRKLARQPRTSDMKKPVSEFSHSAYVRHFGSWNKALIVFSDYINNGRKYDEKVNREHQANNPKSKKVKALKSKKTRKHKTRRVITYRMRYLVLHRDRYKCRLCGSSPSDDKRVKLHVDHIVPWSKGGESILSNLQTLCSKCNLGKGVLVN